MGRRGEVYSTRIYTDEGQKTYFFNVKENRSHDVYLNIVESRKTEQGYKRSSLVVFSDSLEVFIQLLEECAEALGSRGKWQDRILPVGDGRREYRVERPRWNKAGLRITEKREDDGGFYQESIVVSMDSIPEFLQGFKKAAAYISY